MVTAKIMQEELRKLPSVESMLQSEKLQPYLRERGHTVVVQSIRDAIDASRRLIANGEPSPSLEKLLEAVLSDLETRGAATIGRVINATGVIIHTNLGRAPLSEDARAAMDLAAHGYSNLEYDLLGGVRSSRYEHADRLLAQLTGAGAGMLVNNNAGAVLLILTALARGREAIISRGQLVEIGGGFRIPDVMAQGGVSLVEVGTTNRSRIADYESAIGEETALLMHVHHSNFKIVGFTEEVGLTQLAEIAQQHGLLTVEDLGSGCFLDTSAFGLAHEPTVREALEQGADLVCFSGDKLLGGPQAGIIVGRADLISSLKRHPLSRALRVDKTTIAGIQATLLHYAREEATEKIPVWQMIGAKLEELEQRAVSWADRLGGLSSHIEVVPGLSTVGGGSLPGETLPTRLVAFRHVSPDTLAQQLRMGDPPVVGRIEAGQYLLDPRTVLPGEEQDLLIAVERALKSEQNP